MSSVKARLEKVEERFAHQPIDFDLAGMLAKCRAEQRRAEGKEPAGKADRVSIPEPPQSREAALRSRLAAARAREKRLAAERAQERVQVVPQRMVKSHSPEELRCAVLSGPQRTAEWEQYR